MALQADITLQSKFLKFADVLLRVPPLFFIDEIFRIGFSLRLGYGLKMPGNERLFGLTYLDQLSVNGTGLDLETGDFYSIMVYSFFKLVLSVCGKCDLMNPAEFHNISAPNQSTVILILL